MVTRGGERLFSREQGGGGGGGVDIHYQRYGNRKDTKGPDSPVLKGREGILGSSRMLSLVMPTCLYLSALKGARSPTGLAEQKG